MTTSARAFPARPAGLGLTLDRASALTRHGALRTVAGGGRILWPLGRVGASCATAGAGLADVDAPGDLPLVPSGGQRPLPLILGLCGRISIIVTTGVDHDDLPAALGAAKRTVARLDRPPILAG